MSILSKSYNYLSHKNPCSNPSPLFSQKNKHPIGCLLFWQRNRDFSAAAAAVASFRSLPTSAKTVHRTVFFNKSQICSLLVRIPLLYFYKKKQAPYWVLAVFWQRNRDSNPNKQSQSLLCYRYTIPLRRELLYTNSSHLSSVFLIFLLFIFNVLFI